MSREPVPQGPAIGYLLNRSARVMNRFADRRLAPLGFSSGYLPVLNALMAEPVLSQKELTERAKIEQPTMVATLGRMERDGIIRRVPDPGNARSARFALTDETRAKAGAIRDTITGFSADALADLSETEQTDLRAALTTVIARLEALLAED